MRPRVFGAARSFSQLAQGGGVGFFEHPRAVVAQHHRGLGAEEGFGRAVEGVGQGRVVADVEPLGELQQCLHGVGDFASILPGAHGTASADRHRQLFQEPRRDIELVDADLTGEAERGILA
jgi:hypothetical protein